jgi:hypothetical protein
LEIAVGAAGSSPSSFETSYHIGAGGGGGASYVVLVNGSVKTLLEAAGGGGGGGFSSDGSATTGTDGGTGGPGNGSGGTSTSGGGGGAGLDDGGSDAADLAPDAVPASGGSDLAEGLGGGNQGYVARDQTFSGGGGGFGGGGGGGYEGLGGGGGGYTGGSSGEGGTSYIASDAYDSMLMAGVNTGNGEVTMSLACFEQSTRISTPLGFARIDTLHAGDQVLSVRRGIPVPVRWVGHRHVESVRQPGSLKSPFVRIFMGAFGPELPVRDLLLSPDHAIYAEDVLIPVRALVNGSNIVPERVAATTYWHVEVDEHDVILANGLPVESYLNIGHRLSFGGGRVTAFTSGFVSRVWEAEGCAPLRLTGPQVDAVRRRLEAWSNTSRRAR